jgi:hypothetical protein
MAGNVSTAYLIATGRTSEYFSAIQRGTAPSRFTREFLENLGFKSKADRQLVPVLKALRFLDDSNVPTQAYRDYLDERRGRLVLGRQILGAYEGIFELDRAANTSDASDLRGKFKSLTNASENVANYMAVTFKNLCEIADVEGARSSQAEPVHPAVERPAAKPPKQPVGHDTIVPPPAPGAEAVVPLPGAPVSLSYRIEINLPNTTDVEVYRAIFKALREHLIR